MTGRRRYRGPRPYGYARVGYLGPSAARSAFVIILAAAAVVLAGAGWFAAGL
jgi:hypothetical protein